MDLNEFHEKNWQRMHEGLCDPGDTVSFDEDLAAMERNDTEPAPGGMSDADYHDHPGFNQSTAVKLINKSPRHAFESRRLHKLRKGHEDPTHTREREIGTVTHKMLLGSTTGFLEVLADDYRTKVAQEARSRCEREGITPILSGDLDKCRRAATAMREQLKEEFGIELDGQSERVLLWDQVLPNGLTLPCKAKVDHVRADGCTILDIKSGEDANPKGIIRRVLDSGYHIQAGAYVCGLEANEPDAVGRVTFIDLFIETSGLYMCTPVEIQGELLELGIRRWQKACYKWRHCVEEGFYPGYTTRVIKLQCPPWALEREMEDE